VCHGSRPKQMSPLALAHTPSPRRHAPISPRRRCGACGASPSPSPTHGPFTAIQAAPMYGVRVCLGSRQCR
jgi:hypothetical protein